MAPPEGAWAMLPGDILTSIADRLCTMTSYVSARGVCTAWRSALQPASPCLLVAGVHSGYAFSLPLGAAFGLAKAPMHSLCVGASHGWLAVAYRTRCNDEGEALSELMWRMALLNPVTGKQIVLPEHVRLNLSHVTKVAFAPNPRVGDFTVVAAFGTSTLAYISTRDVDGGWSFVYIPEGDVVADLVYRDGGDRVYCLTRSGDVHVLHVPRGRPVKPVLEPLLPQVADYCFKPEDVFRPLYARLSGLITGAKNLVFCGGSLYQVWRNNIGSTFRVPLERGGSFAVPRDEVFVLRYVPARRPCWVPVSDLGGHSVFVGPANSAVTVHAERLPGLKADCVYWMSRRGDGPAMVFDMKTRRSSPCLAPSNAAGVPVCWY